MDFNTINKKHLLSVCITIILSVSVYGQAKKPTIMVVPSDLYCNQKGYMQTFQNQGIIEEIPDYKRALQNDEQLLLVITTLGQMMADRGFPLKLLEQELKSIADERAENEMLVSKSGEDIAENPIDLLKQRAKSDIIMEVYWKVNTTGPRKSITFNLQGIDAYTNKQIAACQGTGAPSFSAELPVLLEEAVINYFNSFTDQLQNHFDDLFANGREVTLRLKKWENSQYDFESEFNGFELGEVIEDWLYDNTVEGRFNTTDATENMMYFEQVRIPLYDDRDRATDTRSWARGLVRKLSTMGIDSKLVLKGLGQVNIIIGGK
jgi:hypothetical protein